MKLEIGKEYKTRSGLKVKVYDIAENKNYSVIAGSYRDGKIFPEAYAINGAYSHNRESDYDIVGEWKEPLDFDWSCLPPWIDKYIAMDKSGMWFAFSKKPKKIMKSLFWRNTGSISEVILIPENYAPKNFKGNWDNSLFKNPNKCEK